MRIPVASQDVLDQEKEKELHGKSKCQLLRNESVNGEAATLYSMHREYGEVKEDAQMWVSRSTDCFYAGKRTWKALRQRSISQRALSTATYDHPCNTPLARHLSIVCSGGLK